MLENPISVVADENIFSAIQKITENKISGVCVVDDQGALVGVLSELDCLRAILSSIYNQTGNVGNVRDFMTGNVECCNLHEDVVDVANDMLNKGHRRRPVVDNGKLVGQITCRRLLKVISEFNKSG
jgi:CBS domain-containing protein